MQKKVYFLVIFLCLGTLFACSKSDNRTNEKSYLKALAKKESSKKHQITVSAELDVPKNAKLSSIAEEILFMKEQIDFKLKIKADEEKQVFEVSHHLPKSVFGMIHPLEARTIYDIERKKSYIPTANFINFFNKTGMFGFKLETTEAVKDKYLEYDFAEEYDVAFFMKSNLALKEAISELEGNQIKIDGDKIVYTIAPEKLIPHLNKQFETFLYFQARSFEQAYNDENFPENLDFEDITLEVYMKNSALEKEVFTVPFIWKKTGEETWEFKLTYEYINLDLKEDISTIPSEFILTDEEFDEYLNDQQRKDIGRIIDLLDDEEDNEEDKDSN